MIKLYENIKYYRKKNSWSQEELAKRMNYTDRSMIAKIESGKVDLSQSKIIEFAKVFGIAPGDLMGWEEIPEEKHNYEEIIAALNLYRRFTSLPPEKQAALQVLLGFPQKES